MPLPVQIEKGRFTEEDTGDSRDFTLNPNEISDNKGMGYPDFELPGQSHPVSQGGGGTARIVSFGLDLNADIGYRNKRRLQGASGLVQSRALVSASDVDAPGQVDATNRLDITDEINWYRHFLYPEGSARLGLPRAQAPILLFSFGRLYQGYRCVMTECNVTVTMWTPRLEPMRARIQISLKEKPPFTVSRSSIYDPSARGLF